MKVEKRKISAVNISAERISAKMFFAEIVSAEVFLPIFFPPKFWVFNVSARKLREVRYIMLTIMCGANLTKLIMLPISLTSQLNLGYLCSNCEDVKILTSTKFVSDYLFFIRILGQMLGLKVPK